MPIANLDDAYELDQAVGRILRAPDPRQRAEAVRRLFVEVLDFHSQSGQVSLRPPPAGAQLPAAAERVAVLDGVHVCYVALQAPENDRVRTAEASAAARRLADQLGDDLLLAVSNASGRQLHLIHPRVQGARPTLRRLVFEQGLPRRTAVQQAANIYAEYRASRSIRAALDAAFDVEPVTRRFFSDYKKVFTQAERLVTGFGPDQADDKRLFVQTLFNRLMFVHFLSRKGWLTFQGKNEYVQALWDSYQSRRPSETNFYRDRLHPLFFCGLNNPSGTDVNGRYMRKVYGDAPFLNGGLFEQSALDRRPGVQVPDEAIAPVVQARSGLFQRFNFTVMESTPYDVEVAVDPEMLGKVFEELVNERHASGAYYTPRPVVAFMCREALKGFLEHRVDELDAQTVEDFVDRRDPSRATLAQAIQLSSALDDVTVIDPACGSGAYLLGMLQELLELQTTLYSQKLRRDARTFYQLKLHVIQRNLYGVDVDPFAVNIAKLRLWLSLAIDYDGDKPEPLPNLDFKIVCGDSLLGPEPVLHLSAKKSELGELKGKFMLATAQKEKDELRGGIAAERARVEQVLAGASAPEGAVNWRLDFAEVFEKPGSFDIAIANPPYVRQEKIGPSKARLVRQYAGAVNARSDLYCYFYARALQLLRRGGQHVFICSNSWLDVGYGARLQDFLLYNAHVRAIYESAVERQFSTAQINTVISVIEKNGVCDESPTRFVSLRGEFEQAMADPTLRRQITKTRRELLDAATSGVDSRGHAKFVGDKWGGKYLRAPDIYHHILTTYSDKFVRLGDIATVRFGIKTGANAFFFLDEARIQQWNIEEEYLAPVMTSPQESRSILVDPDTLPKKLFVCHKEKDELRHTGALAYIQWGETNEYHKRRSMVSRKRWYDLGIRDGVYLAMNLLVHANARTYLYKEAVFCSNNFHVFASKHKNASVCTSLNSTLSQLSINVESRSNFGEGVLEIQTYETANLRIVKPEHITTIDECLFTSSDLDIVSRENGDPAWQVDDVSANRRAIDDVVFDVLGLTQDERDAVYESVIELISNRLSRASSVHTTR